MSPKWQQGEAFAFRNHLPCRAARAGPRTRIGRDGLNRPLERLWTAAGKPTSKPLFPYRPEQITSPTPQPSRGAECDLSIAG
jgi:hypothetical protein